MIGNTKVTRFTDKGVEAINADLQEVFFPADTAVVAFGMEPDFGTVQALSLIAPETCVVGDCDSVKNISYANHSAFNRAVEI